MFITVPWFQSYAVIICILRRLSTVIQSKMSSFNLMTNRPTGYVSRGYSDR